MSRLVDLTPERCRYAFGRRRFIRRWVLVYLLAVVSVAGLYTQQRLGLQPLRSQAHALEAESIARWRRHEELQRLLKERDALVRSMERYDRLAPGVASSDLIRVIGLATPADVTLTFLAAAPREEKERRPVKGGASEVVVHPYLAVEVEGVALDDEALTRFVAGLDGHPLFERVGIEYARSTEGESVDGRAFRLSGRIDLSKRYELVDAAPAAEGLGR